MNFNQLVCQWLSVSSASNRKCSSSHELWSCLTTRKSPNSFCLLFDQSIYCFIISNLTNVFLWNALFAFIEINVTGFGILLSNAVIFWHVYAWSTVSKHCFKELLQIAANQRNTIQKLIFGKNVERSWKWTMLTCTKCVVFWRWICNVRYSSFITQIGIKTPTQFSSSLCIEKLTMIAELPLWCISFPKS